MIQRALAVLIHEGNGHSGQWYDFTATADSFVRQFAGRIEIGVDSISDPAMGQALPLAGTG